MPLFSCFLLAIYTTTCVSTVTNVCDHDEPKACPDTMALVRLPSECGSLLFAGRESAILRGGRCVSAPAAPSVFRRAVRLVFPDGMNACPSSGWSVGRVGWIGKKADLVLLRDYRSADSECALASS